MPALVDVHNPGLTGGVQNQSDFQAGAVDHRTHFASEVPRFVRQAMREYAELTGRAYAPVQTFLCDDADYVMVGLGSVTDDAEAVATHLRGEGMKVGVVAVKLLQPFPEAELVAALRGRIAVTVLERSEVTALTGLVTQALFRARENADGERHAGIPAIEALPRITTAIFGLGAHDLQPRHLVAAFRNMENPRGAPFVYLGSQFFAKDAGPRVAALQERLRAAYPETEFMALQTGPNPHLLPAAALRIRFHSVGGYGTIATGKLLTDILAGALGMHSKSAPKYGSEKSGAPTSYYITLSPEPVKITNAELEDVEIVVSPDHKVFSHTSPLRGLAAEGSFILQSSATPLETWRELPAHARRTIRERRIRFFVVDAFAVARRHAPTPELETRMMGIAFIGAVCGHVERIAGGASAAAVLAKVRQQIAKKFGAKGGPIVESNMEVVREGLEATRRVDYEAAEFQRAEQEIVVALPRRSVALSASMCRAAAPAASAGFLDRDYYDDMVAQPFRDGTIGEAPVLPGTGLFMPPGSAAWKDKGLFRLTAPEFLAERCTGCMECAIVCPDAAIPNTVHDIHDLLLTAIRHLDVTEAQKEALRTQVFALSAAVREAYRQGSEGSSFAQTVAEALPGLALEDVTLRRNLGRAVEVLESFPVARTRPFFDAMEKARPGSGGLFSAAVDPWKCSGCLECIDVCGPGALVQRTQDPDVLEMLQARFEFASRTPNTPARFSEGATRADGETKRLLLDRANYYSTTGGHGACRGCGEVTAIRLVVATNRAIFERRRREHVRELEELIAGLEAKRDHLAADAHDPGRGERIERTLRTLEKRLYLFESGPSGNGPASAVIANSTGCSSVFASTFPFNPYNDPWVNSLFQDAQPLAKGIFEGLVATALDEVRALRTARLELQDGYDAATHDAYFRHFGWSQFTPEEMALLPTVMTIGGDGATYDIGFGALSRLLVTDTPIKVVVLNSGVYSNTGGQASTASFTAQDSDLTRFGAAHSGKQEDRKELGLIAAFHPNVFVVQTSTALQSHFLKSVMAFLSYGDSPAVLDVYTPCQAEHGIADAAASRHARLAVESRMSPVFVHDPRRGDTLHQWFSLEGNPEPDRDWTSTGLEYVDADGATKLLEMPLTPADFARQETRFRKHFRPLEAAAQAVPVHDFINLAAADRAGRTPFVWSTDDDRRLVRLAVSADIVALVEERRKYWRTLQHLAGLQIEALDAGHRAELDRVRHQLRDAEAQRETSLDSIARAMSELAASSKAPSANGLAGAFMPAATPAPNAATPNPATNGAHANGAPVNGAGVPLVSLDAADQARCTNCKTCYQDLGEVFEKTRIVVNGETREVARLKPGALERLTVTPELRSRAAKVAANCDAEIIR